MIGDSARRHRAGECQRHEILRRTTGEYKSRFVAETELLIIGGIADDDAGARYLVVANASNAAPGVPPASARTNA